MAVKREKGRITYKYINDLLEIAGANIFTDWMPLLILAQQCRYFLTGADWWAQWVWPALCLCFCFSVCLSVSLSVAFNGRFASKG